MKKAFLEFLLYGFAYVFLVRTGSITIGMPTAYNAPILSGMSSAQKTWCGLIQREA